MSLIDRYIDAVRRNLPSAQRDDIASELHEILQTQIEEEEALNQRPLTEDELRGILRKYGHPLEVAGRYGAHQYLIGPSVFPAYVFAVRVTLWLFVPIAAFMLILTILTAEANMVERIFETAWTMLGLGLLNLALLTLMFARFSRTRSMDADLKNWDPDEDWEELWELKSRIMFAAAHPVRRGDAVGSIIGLVFLLAWWAGLNAELWRWFGWDPLPFVWAPVWSSVSLVAILLILASIGREVMGLIRPWWTMAYQGIGVLLDLAGLAVLSRLLKAGLYVVPNDAGFPSGIVGLVNTSIFAFLLLIAIGAAIAVVFSVLKLFARSAPWKRASV